MKASAIRYAESELILNADGSVFHLHLLPEQLADKVILVGDRSRTDLIAAYFDEVESTTENREFRTITGLYRGKRISVLSTGIGCGNIDIVLNELDALANINLSLRADLPERNSLDLVRVGTCGGMQPFVPEGTFVASKRSIGLDGVLHFYAGRESVCDLAFEQALVQHTAYNALPANPYCALASEVLLQRIAGADMVLGNTISSCGFYGPQGRTIRLPLQDMHLNEKLESFDYQGEKITNYEMEGSALAGLAGLMGHHAMTVCLVIANRVGHRFMGDYRTKMQELIRIVLDRI